MGSKPLIGINADYRSAKKDSPAYSFLCAGYFDAISKAGGIPIVIPPLADEDDLDRVLDTLDGLLMIGGADLDPRRDGFMLHPSVRLMDARRESFDRVLVSKAARRKLPLMAVGVGMQLLNIAQGGNLFLHVMEDLPKCLPHRDSLDPAHRHGLVVTPGTIMDRVFGEGEIRVNSMHHMACDLIGDGFVVSARAPDGVVEAIESTTDWFALGTQFHPEAESASALDQRIFEEFVEGIRFAETKLQLVAAAA